MSAQMSADPEITVVIATRNRRTWLGQCVESVRAQTGVRYELIVVDDASTDGTWEWLQTLAGAGLKVFRSAEPCERSAARNQGLARASGQYVMFMDDDDWLRPNALHVLAAALHSHAGSVAAVGARWVWFTAENYERRDAHPRVPMVRDIFDELLFGWSAVSGQNLYRTDLVRQIGGYDDAAIPCEDRDLWLRLAPLGTVVLRPETVMTYRVHPSQTRPANIRQVRERVARKAIRALPARKRRHGLLLRRSSRLLDRADDELSAKRLLAGVTSAVRAMATAPAIFCSPLIAEWVVRRLAGRLARRFFPPRAP